MKVSKSIILVTGASSGIGEATVRELSRQGAIVVMAARRVENLNKIALELKQAGSNVLVVPTDVSSRESIHQLVTKAVDAYGRIDGVVNVAGMGGGGRIEDASDKKLEQLVMINLLAPVRVIQEALPFMKHDGSAAIVNIGSIAGEMGTNGMYSATKFGIRGLSDSLRRELWTKHIAVSLIEPGSVRTAMTANRKGPLPGPDIVAHAVVKVLEHPRRALVVPGSRRIVLSLIRLFPAIADRVLGSDQGQAQIHMTENPKR